MKTLLFAALGLSVLMSACTQCPPGDARCNSGVGGGSGGSGGAGGGGGLELYEKFTLDPAFSDRFYMDMVVDKTRNRVGIAYFAGQGEVPFVYGNDDAGLSGTDGGLDAGFYQLKYVEWEDGMVKPPQNVDVVRRMVGISIDFHPTTGEPAIAYLGGGSDMSPFWANSDAALATRTGSTWAVTLAATNGVQVMCGNPVSDNAGSFVVGVWPAIAYETNGNLWYCYRDVHSGQYPMQDWAGSDVECMRGGPNNWTRECTYPGGNTKDAPGGRIDMTLVNDAPHLVWDRAFGGADTIGESVLLISRTNNTWGALTSLFASSNTQAGATIAYDPTEGLGVAVVNLGDGILSYRNRAPGATLFSAPDPVFGDGTGGWWPSLAMDPVNHEPAIAYYACSRTGQQNFSQCVPSYDEVRVTQRINNDWAGHTESVDPASATYVKLGFFADGRKAVSWRERNGTLKLAIRRAP